MVLYYVYPSCEHNLLCAWPSVEHSGKIQILLKNEKEKNEKKMLDSDTIAETIELGPLCGLFLIYNYFLINFLILLLALHYVTFQCGCKNIFIKI